MGFLRDLFLGKKEEESQKIIEVQNEQLNGSIVLELDKMEQRALAIAVVNEEKGKALTEKIENFRNKIEQIDLSEEMMQQEFDDFKAEFEKELKILGEEYLFQELQILIKKLENRIFGETTEEQERKETIGYLEQKLEALAKKQETFSGVKQELYIRELIQAKYRLECYKLLCQYDFLDYEDESCQIRSASDREKIIYSTMMTDDIKSLYDYIRKIDRKYMWRQEKCEELPKIEEEMDELVREIDIKYPETMDLTTIFSDVAFMNKFFKIVAKVRRLNRDADKTIKSIKDKRKQEEEKEKQQEEERRKKEELEEKMQEQKQHYKDLTEEEMKKMIEQLDDDVFDITQSYINILKYEIEVADAKGLLTKKSTLQVDDMRERRVSIDEVALAIQRANALGINYSVILGIDDSETNNMLYYPQGEERNLLDRRGYRDPSFSYIEVKQNYNQAFIEYFMTKKDEHIGCAKGKLCFDRTSIEGRKRFIQIYEELENMPTRPEQIQGVKIGLQMSYLRPIIPILEKLREADIDYYIPTIDNSVERKAPTKEIYIDRQDLEKYEKLIHPSISTKELGEITITARNIDLAKMILGDTKIDFIEQEREEKAKQEKVKNVTEEDVRKEIKRLDDRKYDVTESYKDIVQYQKTVARAKGLLNPKSEMTLDDIETIRIAADMVGSYIISAERQEIAYTVLYDVDDNPNEDCLFIVSKSNAEKIQNIRATYGRDYNAYMLEGKYGESFIIFFQENIVDSKLSFTKDGKAYTENSYSTEIERAKTKLKKCTKMIEQLDDEDYIKNVKCYLEVPYLRPIISILEMLQQENIEYYVPPDDKQFNKSQSTIRIYIDRANMQKYREKVHNKISNAEKGVVNVFGEQLKMSEIMLEGTKSKFVKITDDREEHD